MEKNEMKKMCQDYVDAMYDRMHDLCMEGRSDDASALYNEIKDWVMKDAEIEIMSLDYMEGMFDEHK